MNQITVTIAVPHRCLSPNLRPHWRTRAKYRKAQREEAFVMTAKALGMNKPPLWESALIEVRWFARTRNIFRADVGNLIHSLKGAEDGLADARLIENDLGVRWGQTPKIAVDKKNPRVELVVTEIKA